MALPACAPRATSAVVDAGPLAPPPRPPAPPALPVDLTSCRPIADVGAPATGSLADDFTRPHDVLWKLDELFAKTARRRRRASTPISSSWAAA